MGGFDAYAEIWSLVKAYQFFEKVYPNLYQFFEKVYPTLYFIAKSCKSEPFLIPKL